MSRTRRGKQGIGFRRIPTESSRSEPSAKRLSIIARPAHASSALYALADAEGICSHPPHFSVCVYPAFNRAPANMPPNHKPSVIIVGAGEFGAATACSLLKSGRYGSVTILDRAQTLPAMDAASCDINKVVRYDYADPMYSELARIAIGEWNKPEWKGIYYQ